MNESEAEKIARAFLCEHIEIERCDQPPPYYRPQDSSLIVFSFRLFGEKYRLGASEYISVSTKTGNVNYLGFLGE